MPNNVVIQSRIKPQVRKKNRVVITPQTVQTIIKPSQRSAKDVKQKRIVRNTKKSKRPTAQKPIAKEAAQANNQAAISRPRNPIKKGIRKKQPNVRYSTRNISPESVARIKRLKDSGRGRILVIVGNGPSISEIELGRIKDVDRIDIMSINMPDERVWPTKFWTFFDRSQLRRHKDLWDSYSGILFNSTAIKEQKEHSMQFKNLSGVGFSRDVSKGVYIGRSSVYASMQIALWMNYDHIYILGVDMNPNGMNGKLHFYGVNPDVEPNARAKRFEREAKSYEHAASKLSAIERSKFTFCSKDINPWSFINQFNSVNHLDAIDTILSNS